MTTLFLAGLLACSGGEPSEEPDPPTAEAPSPDEPRGKKGKRRGKRDAPKQGKDAPPSVMDRNCDVGVYLSADADVEVREKPSDDAASIGTLPAAAFELKMELRGAKNGYARIDGAHITIWDSAGSDPPELKATKGWIPLANVHPGWSVCYADDIVRAKAYASPDPSSAVVFDSTSSSDYPRDLAGCSGEWARYTHEGADAWQHPGFQCPSTVTECPGNQCPDLAP